MDDKRFPAKVWTGLLFLLPLSLTLMSGCHRSLGRDVNRAAGEGDLAKFKALLTSVPDIEKRERYRRNGLFFASRTGQVEIVQFCLENGVDSKGSYQRYLLIAVENGHVQVAKLFLASDADINRCGRGKYSGTPLYFAITIGQKDVAAALLEEGADANKDCANLESPLSYALKNDQFELADMLLSHGADINDKRNGAGTALHAAIALNRLHMAEYLLDKGANVNAEIGLGYTPLHLAAYCNKSEAAGMLLAHGADPSLKCDGRTAFEIALSDEFRELLAGHRGNREP